MDGTKFTLDRKIFNSDIWEESPWLVKLWIYLLGNANWGDGVVNGIPLKRGQILTSYRHLRKILGYRVGYRRKYPSYSTVVALCEKLTKAGRTEVRTDHRGTIITICKYNELQPIENTNRSANRSLADHLPITKEVKEVELEPKILKPIVHSKSPNAPVGSQKSNSPNGKRPDYESVISDLNQTLGSNYRATSNSHRQLIAARWKEGFRLEDFKVVHRKMKMAWGDNPEMSRYLRPQTLYTGKFDSYLNMPDQVKARTFSLRDTVLEEDGGTAKKEEVN